MSSVTGRPASTSEKIWKARARALYVSMSLGYCIHGPDFPHRPAFFASATENLLVRSEATPLRFTLQWAV